MTADDRSLAPDAWGAVLRAHAALVPRLDRELRAATGLPLAWYDVLLELYYAPERRLRMSDLGARVVLSRSRVSRLVDEMTRSGLVARSVNPGDARSSHAVLTADGASTFRRAAPAYLRSIDEHFGQKLTPQELRTIAQALGRVAAMPADASSHPD